MTTHATNVELTADEKAAFVASMQRAREAFSRIDGVLSVGFGQKHSAGDFRDIIAITACVLQKKPLEAIANADRIPATFEGYPTDVMQVGSGSAPAGCNNSQEYTMIRGGIQIVPQIVQNGYTYEKGTLGCIVRRRGDSDRENVYLLTCFTPAARRPRMSSIIRSPIRQAGRIRRGRRRTSVPFNRGDFATTYLIRRRDRPPPNNSILTVRSRSSTSIARAVGARARRTTSSTRQRSSI